ncbi:MAG: EamA family transporter [Calditrichota bacterium]
MSLGLHWLVWTMLAAAAWTAWGVAVKYVLRRVDWARLEILSAIAVVLLVAIVAPVGLKIKLDSDHLLGFGAGFLAVLGSAFFYIAVSKGPVSVIVPLSSLYVLGVFLVGVTFLGEEWSLRKALGVACAVAALILLAGESK